MSLLLSRSAAPVAAENVLRRLLRRPAAAGALGVLAILVIAAVFAPELFGSPTHIDVTQVLSAPSAKHWLGTDELGRDLLARLADAGRLSLGLAVASTAISLVAGAAWGVAAASLSEWDAAAEILMRVADAALAIPTILFALVCVAAFGADVVSLTIIVGLSMTPLTARVMRSAVLAELQTDYVRGLAAVGVSRTRVVTREVLPNALPTLLAQGTLNAATAIMLEASLSFVGLGVQPPSASWGTLLQQGYTQLFQAAWYPVSPALVILLAIAPLNVLGAQLQRVLYRGRS